MIAFAIATEDALSEAVAEKLLAQKGVCDIHARIRKEGSGYLKKRVAELNRLAEKVMPVLLITDLDQKRCPAKIIAEWLPTPRNERLLFRVAVRETESWVLADRAAFSSFIGISIAAMPTAPDELSDPKTTLLNLVRKSSNRDLKQDILPAKGSTSLIGLGYNSRLCHFVHSHWKSARAAECSPSLSRALSRIQVLC
ncbi:MAG: hypothetical protein V2J55_04870 [Candidatus Competibacteraceae bacterium]|jgi:hypothetical protein|nr:hypothetical protein [Candidatus Competibacteraceae bacterium]